MEKLTKILAWMFVPLAIVVTIIWFKPKEKTVFIDSIKVYNKSTLKFELEGDLEHEAKEKRRQIDSLEQNLKAKNKYLSSLESPSEQELAKYKQQYSNFQILSDRFQKEHDELKSRYSEQIWENINNKVKDFASKNNYSFVLGANGDGSLMFGKPENDVTEDFIKFLNEK